MQAAGKLQPSSPPEILHAWILQVSERLTQGIEDEELQKWMGHARSSQLCFKRMDDEDSDAVHFHSVNNREAITTNGALLKRTQLGRIYELIHFKMSKDKGMIKKEGDSEKGLPAKAIFQAYGKKMNVGATTEVVSENFVDNALTINSRLLGLPGIAKLLAKADDENPPMSAFSSCSKLHAVVTQAKQPSQIAWTMSALWDRHKAKIDSEVMMSHSRKCITFFFAKHFLFERYQNARRLASGTSKVKNRTWRLWHRGHLLSEAQLEETRSQRLSGQPPHGSAHQGHISSDTGIP